MKVEPPTQNLSDLTTEIEKSPYELKTHRKYYERSLQFHSKRDYDSALIDINKSLFLEPTYEGYIERGKLNISKSMYFEALGDFEMAASLYREKKEERNRTKEKREKNQYKNQEKKGNQYKNQEKNPEINQYKSEEENKLKNQQGNQLKNEQENQEINELKSEEENQEKSEEKEENTNVTIDRLSEIFKVPEPEQSTAEEEQIIEDFLSNSLIIKNIEELKPIASELGLVRGHLSEEQNLKINRIFNDLVEKKVSEKMEELEKKLMQELLKVCEGYKKELEKYKKSTENYLLIFQEEMENSTILEENKCKFYTYFNTIVSEMERYYLSAKVLEKFSSDINFDNCEEKIKEKESKSYGNFVKNVFKFFEKNKDKVERAAEVIKDVPFVSLVFKIVKTSMKGFGWIEKVKIESECGNILGVRPTLEQFNRLSELISYKLVKFFKLEITENPSPLFYRKNIWEKISKIIHKYQRNSIATRIFTNIEKERIDHVEEMAKVHTSILMAGIAYGVFRIPKNFENIDGFDWDQVFEKIKKVEQEFIDTKLNEEEIEKIENLEKESENSNKSACLIF